MALHDNDFIAKSHISRRWKIQFIESPECLSVQQQPVHAQEEIGACGKTYLKDNPQCYLLCQVKEFTFFYSSSQKGAKLTQ